MTPVVLPPWALDGTNGDCTTLVLISPVPTQFLLHVHPWPDLPSTLSSSAGALQLTRCGRARLSLLQILVEMRSPRAVVHTLVAIGAVAPPSLLSILPERDAGAAGPSGDPGPLPEREALPERLRRFEEAAKNSGASSVDRASIPGAGAARLSLEPGCHRLLVTGADATPASTLLLAENDDDKPERLELPANGGAFRELCSARARSLVVSLENAAGHEKSLIVAHFSLPTGLPGRFGPELFERLVQALGGSAAPRKLGPLVSASLGAQGRTPLPRALLPQTCYLAAVVLVHGAPQAISLGVRSGARNGEASSNENQVGTHLDFCTGRSGQVELDVEARGLGLAWLFTLFQMGPARPEEP